MRSYDAVLFDLLTALLDSWSLWNDVAGGEVIGRRWRAAYLALTYGVGSYRPYQELVAEAAAQVGLDNTAAAQLAARYSHLQPWPGVAEALILLLEASVPIGVVTNCSESLGRIASARVGVPFSTIVTAERAGFYKPDPHPYRLALSEIGVKPERCLFVAGSPYDLTGAQQAGLAVWWHNRIGMTKPPDIPDPLKHSRTLEGLVTFVLPGGAT